MCLQVKGSRVYTEHIAQYTEPLAQRVKSTSYYKAAVEHVRPAHMAGAHPLRQQAQPQQAVHLHEGLLTIEEPLQRRFLTGNGNTSTGHAAACWSGYKVQL